MDILGIDIGTVSVKYVRMRGKGAVVSQGEYPHKGGWEDLNFVLTEIKDREGTDVQVAVAVTTQDIVKKTFTIPIIPKEEAKEAIEWSASKAISTPLEDMVYENVILGQVTERGMTKEEVLFVGGNKEYINILLSIFENVGFRRIVTITDPGFLYRSAVSDRKEGPVAVIDIGGRQTGIYVFDNKKLLFVREILTAAESFVDALMGEFELSYDEADRFILEKGFNEESAHILAFPLDRLTGEVQRTFSVYARKYPERPITKIYIAGRASRIPHFIDHMREAFVEQLEHLAPPPGVEDLFVPAYTLCVDAEPLVNLLPEKLKAQKREVILRSWARIASICVLGILLFPSIGMLTNFRKQQISLKTEKTDVASKKDQLRVLASITSASRHNEMDAVRKEIEKRDETLVVLLKYLSSRLPGDVYLREIEFFDRNKRLEAGSKDLPKTAVPAQGPGIKDSLKGTTREGVAGTIPAGTRPQTASPAVPVATGGRPDYGVTIRGYVFGDVDVLESALLGLVINLERSALLRSVEVSKKEVKELRGKRALEFTIIARCAGYEV
ncbi:MAG: Competence protein A [Syntrophorhabdus sp. PtaU1.Bin153]|nr:MAG: Competence protein A [Syntrophorhabdus sp. PtaU1.Bin153]